MSIVKHAIIAAAGMGTRIGLGYPKCLIELGGKPLIIHLLKQLKDVEDVRIVVGFDSDKVIDIVKNERDDVIFIMNPSYRTTTTLTSYFLGSEHLKEPCLYMDADIYFEPKTFSDFLKHCEKTKKPMIAITKVKTDDCVYVDINDRGFVVNFSREQKTRYEWANLAWLLPELLEKKQMTVYKKLEPHLPIMAKLITSYEIDTPADYKRTTIAFADAPKNKLPELML